MSGRYLLLPLLLVFVAVGAAAQTAGQASGQTAGQGTSAGSAPAGGPGEPEIVMPKVILQIEDLSVEKVEAQLPPEEDLLPPERKIPVLSEGDMAVGEPAIPTPSPENEATATGAAQKPLAAEMNLGAGYPNAIAGSVSLKTLGTDPRFSMNFSHETIDGFSGKNPGSGFNSRNDSLDGGLKLRLGPFDTDLSGTFSEKEYGLQGQSVPYVATLSRAITGAASFSALPFDWLTLTGAASGRLDSLIAEGATPLPVSGGLVSPSLSADARFGIVKLGLGTDYTWRADTLGTGDLHRFGADASFGVELPSTFAVDARAGWYWNSAGLSLFPFSVSVTATPAGFLTFSLDGGYKVTPYDLHDVIASAPYARAVPLADDRGWYGDASTQLTLLTDLAATLKVSFMASEALPVGSATQDAATGLLVLTQGAHNQLSSDVGLRWGINQSFSVSGSWMHQYLDTPFFTTSDTVKAEIIGIEPAGRFGGSLSLLVEPTYTRVLQQPVLRASGFWKVADSVKLQVEGDDLLQPLSGPRLDAPPYVSPGFRVEASLSMTL